MDTNSEWKAIFDSISDAVCVLDKNNLIKYCNKTMTTLCGLTEAEIFGKRCWKIVHNTDDHYPNCPLLVMENTLRRESQDMEIKGRWFQVTVDPILDEKKKLFQTVHIIRDISMQKQAEEELKRAADRFRAMIDTAPYGAYLYELMPDGRLIFIGANKSADKILGADHSIFIGKTIEEAFPSLSQTEIPAAFREVAVSGKPFYNEQVVYSDSQWISGTAEVCAFQTAPNKIAALFRDITEKQKMLETLQKSQKIESLGMLAGGIAHDFNNLLGGIFGFIDIARSDPNIDRNVSGYLDRAMGVLLHAKGLTQQLLTFSKGGAPLRKSGSVEKVVRELSHFALSGSNVACSVSIDAGLWNCEFDENQIGQVIENIVINAQQAMPTGGTVELTVQNYHIEKGTHHILQAGDYVRISVRDSGIGIPKEIIARIFDPFFTTKQEGHGLGLATAYSVISKHNGCIDVESEPGKGSVFHVYLPASPVPIVPSAPEADEIPKGSGRILFMDDFGHALHNRVRGYVR